MLSTRPGLPEGARKPHFLKHTIQLFSHPPSLHRHPSFKRCRIHLCVPGYFSSLHLKQLIDLRLGERDGEGGGERKETLQFKIPGAGPACVSRPLNVSLLLLLYTHTPLIKKYQRRRDHPNNIPGRSPGEAGSIIQRHLPQLPMESGPCILLINLHSDSERKRREKKGSETERRQEGRTPKIMLDLYLLAHILQG